ncbi:hypothetical protein LJ739_01440 [Aestuariibacter halophilus]|uniref:Nitroreductase domain-containing protein n=1 Tax=Fluctibacter halophilus TaxID=226011 RepID=A0ABS8G475_9ALTE|nr:hypothetical protein [Aestuariibacter halophilus]MCC2614901.1 hypothetical protein [Aestuariibacter halophilus]
MTLNQQQQRISESARWAPSADNSIPWTLHWSSPNHLQISNDPDHSGKATDKTYVLTALAMGAALENARLSAATFGWQSDIAIHAEADARCIDIVFTPQSTDILTAQDALLEEQIAKRHTDRRFPFKGPVTQVQIDGLKSVISNNNGHCEVFTDKADKARLIPIVRRAEAVRFQDPTLHEELFSTVSFDEASPAQGMSLEVLGIEPPARPFFRWIRRWSVMKTLNLLGTHQSIAMRSVTLPMKLSPAIAYISTADQSFAGLVECGRQIQRFWLQATALGLAVHPYAAPGVLTLANPDLPETLRNTLAQTRQDLHDIAPQGQHPVMFFRLGIQSSVPVRSGRRPLESLLR